MKQVIKFMILGIFLTGCNMEKDPVKYSEAEDNGLRKKVIVDKTVYTIQYKSPNYIIKKEHLDPARQADRIKQLEGMIWLNISLSIDGFNQSPLRYQVSGLEEYTARQDYYLNKAPKDMYMLYGKDTLYVNSYWFENNQNLLPYETIVVGFRLPANISKPEQDLSFSFYDRVFHNGIIKSVFRKEDIQSVPE